MPPGQQTQTRRQTTFTKATVPVLVVDDEAVTRLLVREHLKGLGWNVLEAASGGEGLALIKQYGQEGIVVLTDLEMPGMDGLEMLEQSRDCFVESVVLTSRSDAESARHSFRSGATEFFTKPVRDWSALNDALEIALSRLQSRHTELEYNSKLEQQADWHYWKAMFLGSGDHSELQRVLDALHVQFNQDANYTALVQQFKNVQRDGDNVIMDSVLYDMVKNAIVPVARLAEGIGLAKFVMNSTPRLQSVPLVRISDWIKQLEAEVFAEHAAIRGHKLSVWVDEHLFEEKGFLHVDKEVIFTVLTELVINAMKYSNEGDEINFTVQCTEKRELHILITNPARPTTMLEDGTVLEGIPREIAASVFRFFIRFSKDTTQRYHESWPMGLGLPLSLEVLKQHKGQISLRNERWHLSGEKEPSTRVTCRVVLPIYKEALPEQQFVSARSTMMIMKKLRDEDVPVDTPDGDVDGVELF